MFSGSFHVQFPDFRLAFFRKRFLFHSITVAVISAIAKNEPGTTGMAVAAMKGSEVVKVIYRGEVSVSKLNEEGRFLLSIVKNVDEDITVKIYDGYNNLLHNTTKKVSGDLAELYFISEYRGACTFEVSNSAGTTKVFNF